jgi:hypothetical protein
MGGQLLVIENVSADQHEQHSRKLGACITPARICPVECSAMRIPAAIAGLTSVNFRVASRRREIVPTNTMCINDTSCCAKSGSVV